MEPYKFQFLYKQEVPMELACLILKQYQLRQECPVYRLK